MSIETMRIRLGFDGGKRQQDRMILDKLRSLKKALLYSYQAGTAILKDGREFRCLMNPDRLKNTYEDKIISIPFKDICIGQIIEDVDEFGNPIRYEVFPERKGKTSDGEEETGIASGDVFEWKENQSYWLIYLQHEEEYAYFRGECRRCYHEVDVNGTKYKVYVKGPDQNSIEWHTKKEISWNDLNYHAEMYITRTEETEAFFHRFSKIKIEGKPYEVQVVDYLSNPGIITMKLKETYQNTIEEDAKKEEEEKDKEYIYVLKIKSYSPIEAMAVVSENTVQDESLILTETAIPKPIDVTIKGPEIVYPYDRAKYYLDKDIIGTWSVNEPKKVKILNQNNSEVNLEIITSRKGQFILTFTPADGNSEERNITIGSL